MSSILKNEQQQKQANPPILTLFAISPKKKNLKKEVACYKILKFYKHLTF